VSAFGAVIGLVLAIVLIMRKNAPAYSLILGALVGGLVGGASLGDTVSLMIEGAKGITPAILRILTAGVLAGVLIESGAAGKIAEKIIDKLGEKRALLALALATMILTAVGVFVDVAVITVSPIALAIGKRLNLSKLSILLAMIGGGKSGNVISPNPNTIAAADAFKTDLSSLMAANFVPGLFGLAITVFLAKLLVNKGSKVKESDEHEIEKELPEFKAAILGPIVTIFLLALRPITGISIDPLIALPVGGIVGCFAMKKMDHLKTYMSYGLSKMTGVAVLLIGTGTIAGIISNSTLKDFVLKVLEKSGLPEFLLAPTSGAFMSAATASTTAGTTVASATFAAAIMAAGIKGLYGAAMVHAGATVFDHLPHGSFFHATAGSTNTHLKERFKLIPYESAVGFTIAFVSTLIYGGVLSASANAPVIVKITKMEKALQKVEKTGKIDVERKGEVLEVSMPGDISFNTNSSTIKKKYYDILDEVADVLYDYEGLKITIIGHTDSQGDDKYNLGLSLKRAASVRNYLKDEDIREERMIVKGRGESDPVAPNTTAMGRRQNRRVTIEVEGY